MIKIAVCLGVGLWAWSRWTQKRPAPATVTTVHHSVLHVKAQHSPEPESDSTAWLIGGLVVSGLATLAAGAWIVIVFLSAMGMAISALVSGVLAFLAQYWFVLLIAIGILLDLAYFAYLLRWKEGAERIEAQQNLSLPGAESFFSKDPLSRRNAA